MLLETLIGIVLLGALAGFSLWWSERKMQDVEIYWKGKPVVDRINQRWYYKPEQVTQAPVKTSKSSATRMKTALRTANELQASVEVLEMEEDEEYKALNRELEQLVWKPSEPMLLSSLRSKAKKSPSKKPTTSRGRSRKGL